MATENKNVYSLYQVRKKSRAANKHWFNLLTSHSAYFLENSRFALYCFLTDFSVPLYTILLLK